MSRTGAAVGRRTLVGGGLAGLLGAGALAGCGWDRGTSAGGTPDGAAGPPRALEVRQAREVVRLDDVPQLDRFATGLGAFARDLHGVSASATQNWSVSALSLATAFGMLRAGARGRTAEQIDEAFHFGSAPGGAGSSDGPGAVHRALNALTAALVTSSADAAAGSAGAGTTRGITGSAPRDGGGPTEGSPPVVAVANGLFPDVQFADAVRPDYLALLAREYGARATSVSFSHPSGLEAINTWVVTQTRGKIDKLFEELPGDTRLVLANAVYLKAVWLHQFERELTQPGPFRTMAGAVEAQLMRHRLLPAGYAESREWQRVTLRYRGGELAMRVVVPREVVPGTGELNRFLRALDGPGPDGEEWVDLTLPRWDTRTSLELAEPLGRLGVTDAFGPADLSGISDAGLFVSDARHVADVTVDEEGTEAAAVTGIAMRSSLPRVSGVVVADRPFVWAVVHEPTGTPLFTGQVVDPTAG